MFDTLQPSSLIPYTNEIQKIEPVSKLAIIIPINTEAKINLAKTKKLVEAPAPPFEEWNLPVQAEGYIRGKGIDFL